MASIDLKRDTLIKPQFPENAMHSSHRNGCCCFVVIVVTHDGWLVETKVKKKTTEILTFEALENLWQLIEQDGNHYYA